MRRNDSQRALVDERLADEVGTIRKDAPARCALVYPSPYEVAMSSLGFQAIYRLLNAVPAVACERAFLPDGEGDPQPLSTYETGTPVGNFPVVLFSVAYELEIAGVLRCLERAGIEPLREDRARSGGPFVVCGGPLTFSNPLPLAPFADAMLLGEADQTAPAFAGAFAAARNRDDLFAAVLSLPGGYVPEHHGERLPEIAQADDAMLPAHSQIVTPRTELRSMFLVEAARGCSRGCTYCVMRRSTNGGMRVVAADRIVSSVPGTARRVGLVGAAVSDHPEVASIVERLADGDKGVSLSSLRPDRLTDRLVAALRRGGYRTLTTASDGASQRLRDQIERGAKERHLRAAADLVRRHGLDVLKLYMMLGLPGETDDDVEELIRFTRDLSATCSVALGVAPFVPKRRTPLAQAPFAGIEVVEGRLAHLREGLAGRAEVRPTSARWAWVEYRLAQGGWREGRSVLDATRAGGSFAAFRRALAESPAGRAPILSLPVMPA